MALQGVATWLSPYTTSANKGYAVDGYEIATACSSAKIFQHNSVGGEGQEVKEAAQPSLLQTLSWRLCRWE